MRRTRRLEGNRIEVWLWSEHEPTVYRSQSINDVSLPELVRRGERRWTESRDTPKSEPLTDIATGSSLADADYAVSGF